MHTLNFPAKSHRKIIRIPEESEKLAEFVGIEFGDGGVTNPWQIVISFNSIADKDYIPYVYKIITELFEIKPAIRERRGKNCTVIVSTSTSMVEYLVVKGVVIGNKVKLKFDIPDWIKNNINYCRSFVRGMIDTDGGLYIHNHVCSGHTYHNLGLCFSSYSPPLLKSVHSILVNSGISAKIHGSGNKLYVYKAQDIERYLNIFGSSNPRILNKYQEWRGVRVA